MALGSDFDFRRHIVSGRARVPLSPHQDFGARVIGGWSDGVLPPQRQFAIGGLGSVHGYGFKEAVGSSLALVNLEYGIGWRNGPKLFGLFDAGRVTSPSQRRRAVAQRRRGRPRRRRRPPRLRLQARRRSQLASGHRPFRPDFLILQHGASRSHLVRVLVSGGDVGVGPTARRAGQERPHSRRRGDRDRRAARRASGPVQETGRRRRRAASAGADRTVGEPAGVGPAGVPRDRQGVSSRPGAGGAHHLDHRHQRSRADADAGSAAGDCGSGEQRSRDGVRAVLRARGRDAGHAGRSGSGCGRRRRVRTGVGNQWPRLARPSGVPHGAAGERLSAERHGRSEEPAAVRPGRA